ncbi:MAG TPA: plastocyanin/azurin family copper-binding protein [Gemmatimonadales bacterium]|nr:plastocyanin/azurin family copper-binding protein [Gemmatimonadales bacterium]
MVQKLPLGIAAALLLAFVALSATPARNVDAQDANVVVQAGGGETGYAVNAFLPGSITIEAGSSVTWEFPWLEPHIVAFLPEGAPEPEGEPAVSPPGTEWPNDDGYVYSGLIFGDPATPPTFGPIVFPEAGTYQYFCPIHPGMTATVTVVAAGGEADTQADIDARGEAEYASRIADIKAVAATVAAQEVKVTPRADGTNLFEIVVGAMNEAGDDAMQFFPPAINVKTGDTVKWVTNVGSPHTVTFNAPPGPPEGDPFAIPRTANTTFDGTGFTHSGILSAAPEEGVYTSYELTFTATGSFTYVCILHAPQGMVGAVNVTAATTPTPTPTATATPTQTTAPQPPATGTGTAGTGSTPIWLLAIAGLVVMAAGGSVVFAARR